MKFSKILAAAGFVGVATFQSLVSAQLTPDFSLDSSNYFSSNPQARAAAIAAVADLNAALNQNLSAITAANRTVSRSFGTATVSQTVSATVTNPSNGNSFNVSVVSPASVVRIYFGARPMALNTLGVGGTGGWSSTGNANGNLNDVETAIANAANAVSTIYLRGEGPLISELNSAFDFGDGNVFPFQLNLGLAHANVSLNSSTNNFHFDHTTLPTANEVDFYSVVLHETMHAVGLGPSNEWDGQVNGTSWTGSEVIGLRGGAGVLASDQNHIAPNLVSPRIIEGRLQQSVLAPVIFAGVRLGLTELDLAFMRDIGYPNAVVPPRSFQLGDFDIDGVVDLADLDRYNSNLDQSAVGPEGLLDLNGNGTVDQSEFETMYTTLVRTSNGRFGTLAGDIDLDGEVDVLNDAFLLVANLGSSSINSWSQGDLNADGEVDVLNDAFLLIGNLGASNVGTATAELKTVLDSTSVLDPSAVRLRLESGIQCGCQSCTADEAR